jgi:hypothetical protein
MRVVFLLLVAASLCNGLQMSPVAIANAKIMRMLRDGLNPELRGGAGLKRSASIVSVNEKENTQYAFFDEEQRRDVLLKDQGRDVLLKNQEQYFGMDTFEGQSGFFDESNMADNSAVWYTAGMLLAGTTAFL